MISIEKASLSDSQILSELAKAIYVENYSYLWDYGGMEWYMHEYAYPPSKIYAEITDTKNAYYLVRDGHELVGYLKLVKESWIEGFTADEVFEVERIYLLQKMKGKGIGKIMMQYAMDIARSLGKKIIFLKAMDSSQDATRFYQKMGFEIRGTLQLPMPTFSLMKACYRGMVLLTQKLSYTDTE